MAFNSRPPPLPPRLASESSPQSSTSFLSPRTNNATLHSTDPRTSSMQCLVSSLSASETRRKLLVVFIHGFHGNDQSFRSFPAHVRACLRTLLSSTHVIHSKIYPRYKTYKAIEVARDDFSARHPFKHKILGIIGMDAPFSGLHPGIVMSGIASLFQPAPGAEDLPQQQSPATSLGRECSHAADASSSVERLLSVDSRADPIYTDTASPGQPSRRPTDPYFDTPFHNDAPFREQSFLKRLMNFTAKHNQEGLFTALGNHINSHLEYGGCLADYRGSKMRYDRLRALEDVGEIQLVSNGHRQARAPGFDL
ncbi:hypothetical protein E4U41_003342 [Claviceps citrina]|nr:hypothetical protein E4U41_003342 [Claviceps citrina]